MRKKMFARAVCGLFLGAACMLGISGCSGSESGDATASTSNIVEVDVSDTSGGVAATVNGVEIGENAVNAYIANFRTANGLLAEEDWAEWLLDYAYSIDSVRGDTLTYFENQELLRQAAEAIGISVSDEQVDQAVEEAKSSFESDGEWQDYLAQQAMTETGYRNYMKLLLLSQAMLDELFADEAAGDDAVIEYVQDYADTYDGAKRSSHILFDAGDKELAEEVLAKINSGELDFADAAAEYSTDEATASEGGDVGWDRVTTFVDEYQDALDGLSEGEVSGLVTSDYGIHIILCTEVLSLPDELTSVDQLPESFVSVIRQAADSLAQQEAYSNFMYAYRDASTIVEEFLPDDAPYYVDLGLYDGSSDKDGEDAEDEGTDDGDDGDADADAAGSDEGSVG